MPNKVWDWINGITFPDHRKSLVYQLEIKSDTINHANQANKREYFVRFWIKYFAKIQNEANKREYFISFWIKYFADKLSRLVTKKKH